MEHLVTAKKILIISSEFPPDAGGIGNHAYNLSLFFSREQYLVTVVADQLNTSKNQEKSFHDGAPYIFKSVKRRGLLPITYLNRVIQSVAQAGNQDCIFCSGKFSLWVAIVLRVIYPGKKMIGIVHGTELDLKAKWAQGLTTRALLRFNAIISVSEYTKQLLSPDVLSAIPVFVIPNGIDMREFGVVSSDPHPVARSNDDILPIITIGSITERKGQEQVITALPALLKIYPKLHYHMVGKPVEREKLSALARQLGVQGSLSFHGMLNRSALKEMLQKSTLKIMLSGHTATGDLEGFGIALLEANALGKPVIAARTGGIPDAVLDHRSGILVDPHNTDEIVNAFEEILSNYASYVKHAKEWAEAHDWSIIIQRYINVLG